MRQNERRIKFIRVGGPVRTVGWLKGELNVFTGLQLFFTTSKHLANLFNYFVSEVVGTIHRQWPGEQEQL